MKRSVIWDAKVIIREIENHGYTPVEFAWIRKGNLELFTTSEWGRAQAAEGDLHRTV